MRGEILGLPVEVSEQMYYNDIRDNRLVSCVMVIESRFNNLSVDLEMLTVE